MKLLAPVLTALLLAAPAFAGGVAVNLPTLSWPATGPDTTTDGCGAVVASGPAPVCEVTE